METTFKLVGLAAGSDKLIIPLAALQMAPGPTGIKARLDVCVFGRLGEVK